MNETIDSPAPEPAWFFTAEDHGAFSVLRFGRHIPEPATDLRQTEMMNRRLIAKLRDDILTDAQTVFSRTPTGTLRAVAVEH